MSDEPPLTDEQRDALALDRNVAVTAGAGTGKTFTLKERYRHILQTRPGVDPEDILVITFTNDAASELEGRIREVVHEELDASTGSRYDRWRAVGDGLDEAYIHTIHAFCSRVLREFAPDAGVDPEFETLDETEADRLASEAITVVLDAAVTDDGRTGDELERSIRRLSRLYPRGRLERLLERLLDERPTSVTWMRRWADESEGAYLEEMLERFPPAVSPSEALALLEDERVASAFDEIVALADLEFPFDGDEDRGIASIEQLSTAYEALDPTDGLESACLLTDVCDLVTTNDGSMYSARTRHYFQGAKGRWRDHGLADTHDRLGDAFDRLIDALDPEDRPIDRHPAIARSEAPYAVSLARVFRKVYTEYERAKRNRSALDYSDLIARATRLLRDDDRVRATLADQFRYIMVDEVQDTDPRQWEIVRLLSGDDPTAYDGRNVFLVGDEKQSIYGFRGADVAAFRRERERLARSNRSEPEGTIGLSTNFRTLEEPLDFVNALFDRMFRPGGFEFHDEASPPESAPYEADPQRLSAGRPEGTAVEGTVEYLLVPHRSSDARALGLPDEIESVAIDPAEREAFALAARLTRLFASDELVYDPDRKEVAEIEPRHVAILLRSKTRLSTFERALESYDIPYTNLIGSGFYDTPEIRPLLNLLRTLEEPSDDRALYGVLRSPLFGFADDDLVEAAAGEGSLWSAMADEPHLEPARERLAAWRSLAGLDGRRRVNTWSSLVSRIIEDTGYLASVGADERPRQAVANVEQFRERLRNWEEGSALAISSVIDRIETEREGASDPSEATIPGDIEGVQLRTIHSSKGLQFPVVVLPELGRQFNIRPNLPSGVIATFDDEVVLGLRAPTPTASFTTAASPAYSAANDRLQREALAEEKRVLYVGLTRARDHLLLSGLHATNEGRLAEANDPDEATRYTDWLQPILLERMDVLEGLATARSTTATLDDASYRISRPAPAVDWRPTPEAVSLPTDLEVEPPPRSSSRLRLTATEFRDVLAELEPTATGADLDESAEAPPPTERGPLEPKTFGEIVHTLCELRPPPEAWSTIIQRCRPMPSPLGEDVVRAIASHAKRGIEYVEALHETVHPDAVHDELAVTLRLDHGRIAGDVDHLAVAGGTYHVVDYKTSNLARNRLADLSKHYRPQLEAYAVALFQADDALEAVTLHLLFTERGEPRTWTYEPATLEEMIGTYDDTLRRAAEGSGSGR